MSAARERKSLRGKVQGRPLDGRGFTLVEILIAGIILVVGLLAIATMFPTGHTNVTEAGKMTMAFTAARQILEDMRSVPFDNLLNFNGFDTRRPATLPANDPEREIARRWRYVLAGEGDGFTFTMVEKARWATLSTAGATFGGSGGISVVAQSATLRLVTITISIPGRSRSIALATLINRM